jgi:hypothetical protein
MKASELIAELQKLDPDHNVDAWLKSRMTSGIKTLSFDDAGRAIRLLLRVLGKPYGNSNMDMSGNALNHRNVIWKCSTDEWVNGNRVTDPKKFNAALDACEQLTAIGITDFKITDSGWFTIHIPYEAYYSSFTTSDDPEVWKQRQSRNEQNAQNRLHAKALKEEERRKKYQEESKEWQLKYEQEKAQKAKEEQEKELLLHLGKKKQDEEEKAKQIKPDNVLDIVRAVNVQQGGD